MGANVSIEIEEKIGAVIDLIRNLKGAVVALSAGVDSSLVALLARRALGDSAVSVTGVSESLPPEELEVAKATAKEIGIRHVIVRTHELQNPDYYTNPQNRCYFCKETLYTELRKVADGLGFEAILDGTQVDDLSEDRPGLLASREAGVISPLAKSRFSKAEVREAARFLGLSVWDKPAMPCLSSRIPHGEQVTVERLVMIGRAELYIKQLTWVKNLRVRYNNSEARIEVAPEERRIFFDEDLIDRIDAELRRLGFTRVTFDLRGYSKRDAIPAGDDLVLPMSHVDP